MLEPSVASELHRILATAQAERRMPSVSASVFRDGEIVWEGVLGVADVASSRAATANDVYRIGSITKTFTAVLVMQLVDAGRIELDAPLRTYLPEAPVGPDGAHGPQPSHRASARAARRDLGVDGAPVAGGADRRSRGCGARSPAGRAVALLEPRLRAARRDRDARRWLPVRGAAPGTDPRSTRAHANESSSARAEGEPVLRRSLHRRRARRARPRGDRHDRSSGMALVDARRPGSLGNVPRRWRRSGAAEGHARPDVAGTDDGRRAELERGVGARSRAVPPRRQGLRRPRRCDAGVPGGPRRRSWRANRGCGADEHGRERRSRSHCHSICSSQRSKVHREHRRSGRLATKRHPSSTAFSAPGGPRARR